MAKDFTSSDYSFLQALLVMHSQLQFCNFTFPREYITLSHLENMKLNQAEKSRGVNYVHLGTFQVSSLNDRCLILSDTTFLIPMVA